MARLICCGLSRLVPHRLAGLVAGGLAGLVAHWRSGLGLGQLLLRLCELPCRLGDLLSDLRGDR